LVQKGPNEGGGLPEKRGEVFIRPRRKQNYAFKKGGKEGRAEKKFLDLGKLQNLKTRSGGGRRKESVRNDGKDSSYASGGGKRRRGGSGKRLQDLTKEGHAFFLGGRKEKLNRGPRTGQKGGKLRDWGDLGR